ncbi:MAG: hypothetical protein GY825_13650 [Phycisphaeraceae bacterium]|nr:hypothetical protein [Phycisphaeraceae bacterium]
MNSIAATSIIIASASSTNRRWIFQPARAERRHWMWGWHEPLDSKFL